MSDYRLTPRETADLIDLNRRHTASHVNIRWNDDRTADLIDPPKWAEEALKSMRDEQAVPSLKHVCPTCGAGIDQWCEYRGNPKRGWLHDQRKFAHWESEHGKSISGSLPR